ncbi:MAG: hypothetical protein AAF141_07285, partial [Pseudomonadota bacterium]
AAQLRAAQPEARVQARSLRIDQACAMSVKARGLFAEIGMPHMVDKVDSLRSKWGCPPLGD